MVHARTLTRAGAPKEAGLPRFAGTLALAANDRSMPAREC
jgi:hypothetical protein